MTTLRNPEPVEPRAVFSSAGLSERLKPWYEDVIKQFKLLPSLRLLCFFDDDNPDWLHRQFGEFAAVHTPIIGSGAWPEYVERLFFDSGGEFAFDNLIYVPGTRYAREKVSFVIVLAHELQHFVQWGNSPKVTKANHLLYLHLGSFEPMTGLRPWSLPHNREALIIAKRVAEAVCGFEPIREFIEAQILEGQESNNLSKKQMWEWAQSISPSTASYDLLKETDLLVQKYKANLVALKREDIDFSSNEWWALTP